MDPVYDVTDNFGAVDENGNDIGDGILDNPGDIIFHKKTRTGQKDNYSLGLGFSMTWSTPTDKKLQALCKEAAQASIAMMQQQTANKRPDFEIARLKNCGTLLKQGISFHPKSPYYSICADVVVNNVTVVKPHAHTIPHSTSSSSSDSSPQQTEVFAIASFRIRCSARRSDTDSTLGFLPLIAATFFRTFFTVGLITFNKISAKGFASSAEVVATTAIPPVVITVPVGGNPFMAC